MLGRGGASGRLRAVEDALATDLVAINRTAAPNLTNGARGSAGAASKRPRVEREPRTAASSASSASSATARPAAATGLATANGSARSKPLPQPPPPVTDADPALLRSEPRADADELYSDQEQALNTFLKLHPMLSVDSTSHATMQLVANLTEEIAIPTQELEVVPRSYDESMLRMPNASVGERPCSLGERCVCVWLARWRYGDDTKKAFVGTEFLLPSQQRTFDDSGVLPATPGKCLLCTRYFHTYMYRLARSDPTFDAGQTVPLQAYANAVGVAEGREFPTHASPVNSGDGYAPEAMLFCDEEWANTSAARTSMGNFLWRPVVRFSSNHYRYVEDPASGMPRIVQVGLAPGEMAPASTPDAAPDFWQPAPHPLTAAESACSTGGHLSTASA